MLLVAFAVLELLVLLELLLEEVLIPRLSLMLSASFSALSFQLSVLIIEL